jgi:WhiB family redox-sensing transcriptional regulator
MSWRRQAACLGVPQDIFFPNGTKFTDETWQAARDICALCAVRSECLAVALAVDVSEDRWGMFGGMTPRERRQLRLKVGSDVL